MHAPRGALKRCVNNLWLCEAFRCLISFRSTAIFKFKPSYLVAMAMAGVMRVMMMVVVMIGIVEAAAARRVAVGSKVDQEKLVATDVCCSTQEWDCLVLWLTTETGTYTAFILDDKWERHCVEPVFGFCFWECQAQPQQEPCVFEFGLEGECSYLSILGGTWRNLLASESHHAAAAAALHRASTSPRKSAAAFKALFASINGTGASSDDPFGPVLPHPGM